jgi:hypothetical protein
LRNRSQFSCNSTLNKNDFRKYIVQAIVKYMSMLFRHYFGHGSYLIHIKAYMHLSHTRNLAKTYFFLPLWITYRHWRKAYCVERPTKTLLEKCNIRYRLTRKHKEYMMAAILSNRWCCCKKFRHVTRHCTAKVSLPALVSFCIFSVISLLIYTEGTQRLTSADITWKVTVIYQAAECLEDCSHRSPSSWTLSKLRPDGSPIF